MHQPALLEYISNDRIASNAQLDGALEYLGALGAQPLDVAAFKQASGVGVVVRLRLIDNALRLDVKRSLPNSKTFTLS